MKRIYLDYAATTPTDPRVVDAMLPYFTEVFGNPSSNHSFSQEAKAAVTSAREKIAAFIGADLEEIIFTSGGTESDNMALKGAFWALKGKRDHIITSPVEHHAILETCRFLEREGAKVTYLPVDRFGRVDPDDVRRAVTPRTLLISVMHANNEIGTLEPIREIGKIARDLEVYFHTDAVQTFGHLPIDVDDLQVDLLSASGHKCYGPKGIGILYVRKGTRLNIFMHGGSQEKGRRASTHNVPGILGFAAAVELASREMALEQETLIPLREILIRGILDTVPGSCLNGDPEGRLPGNVHVSIPDAGGEDLLMALNEAGIACSTGAACAASSMEPSHVLLALGMSPERADGSLRFSMGRYTTKEDVQRVLEVLPGIVSAVREGAV